MWRIWPRSEKALSDPKQREEEDSEELNLRQLKQAIEGQLRALTKQFGQSEGLFREHYLMS
jgi:hypothetical protein